VELQGRLATLNSQGLALVAVSYDSPATLSDFARRRGITFPMLSDTASAVIGQYQLLNRQVREGTAQYGIPYPGTFVLDHRGIVTGRYFEEAYQERTTVESILTHLGGRAGTAAATRATTHELSLLASATDAVVAPGTRFSLIVDVTPKPRIHVYAPGAIDYRPIALAIDPQPALLLRNAQYPKPSILYFKPLDERVPVYDKPFRIVQDVTLDASREGQARLKDMTSITIAGAVTYQACDDKVCFIPATVPVSWTLQVRQLDTERVKK
jgi:hypothetical protein